MVSSSNNINNDSNNNMETIMQEVKIYKEDIGMELGIENMLC